MLWKSEPWIDGVKRRAVDRGMDAVDADRYANLSQSLADTMDAKNANEFGWTPEHKAEVNSTIFGLVARLNDLDAKNPRP